MVRLGNKVMLIELLAPPVTNAIATRLVVPVAAANSNVEFVSATLLIGAAGGPAVVAKLSVAPVVQSVAKVLVGPAPPLVWPSSSELFTMSTAPVPLTFTRP